MAGAETGEFLREVQRFRDWAAYLDPARRGAEWETEYPHWNDLYEATRAFFDARAPASWTSDERAEVLYVLARDNECENILCELRDRPQHLLEAAREALRSAEPDSKWQLAHALGALDPADAEPLLVRFLEDPDEYVRRRALLALGTLKSRLAEEFAERAWADGYEYQRIAALQALFDAESPRLEEFLARAEEDGREYVVQNAMRLRADRAARDQQE